jgi:aminoglycoside phosphotransferase (APT) family kinase protein
VVHRDLNVKNILIEGGDVAGEGGVRARILDLDRASVGEPVGDGARRRMLERFWRSVRKWEARTGRSMATGPRRAFEEAYRGPGNTIRG